MGGGGVGGRVAPVGASRPLPSGVPRTLPRPPALPPRVSPGGGEGTSQPPSFFTVVGKALLFCFRFDLFAF